MNNLKYIPSRFYKTLLLLLIAIDFFGLIPFDFLTLRGMQLLIYVPLTVLGLFQRKTIMHKCIFAIYIAVFCNAISSFVYNSQSIIASLSASTFVFHFSVFFALYSIKPSYYELEKASINLAYIGLLLYFIQYIFLGVPILSSVTGWRAENEYDLVRFDISGETIIVLTFLMFLNRMVLKFKRKYLVFVILSLLMFLLHGYRSILIGVVLAFLFMYYRIYGLQKFYKVFLMACLAGAIFYGLTQFDFLKESLSFMSEKSANESGDIESNVRIMELLYFYNEYLQCPFEWVFGGGFPGNSSYGKYMQNIQDVGSLFYGRVNWVDLGFIGMSFVGGLTLVILWLRLLLLTLKKVPTQYLYIGAFTIYIMASSITLNIGCTSSAIAIECVALYMFMLVFKNKKNEKNSILLK